MKITSDDPRGVIVDGNVDLSAATFGTGSAVRANNADVDQVAELGHRLVEVGHEGGSRRPRAMPALSLLAG